MDPQRLAQMLDAVKQQKLRLYSLLVIRNGYIVSETYFPPGRPDVPREVYSVTKSFVSTLFGLAVGKGYVDTIQDPVLDFFPERSFKNRDGRKEAMTLEDVLTMRSGLDWHEDDPTIQALYRSQDWVKYVLDLPMKAQPGSRFNYCTGCSHLLSAILQAKTGMNTGDWADKELFGPLGIRDYLWSRDNMGIPIGGWGLQLAPRDMAKLGYLYLHGGIWDGQPIVSAEWVQAATEKHTDTDSDRGLGYGYQWWTYPAFGAYGALGRNGQTIFVIPDLDLIVVTTAEIDGHEAIFDLIEKYIVPAAEGR